MLNRIRAGRLHSIWHSAFRIPHSSLLHAVRHEHVTESPYRLDKAWLGGIRLDQLAQARHLHVDRAVESAELAPARELHQLVARERRARMLHEHLEQREFTRSELDVLAVADEAARSEVEPEVPELDDLLLHTRRSRRLALRRAPQYRLDASDELARVEGLRQVIVGADFEADDAIDVVALGGEHDDRHFLAQAA